MTLTPKGQIDRESTANCKTATITFAMDHGDEAPAPYPASRKRHPPNGKKKKADREQPRYGRKP